MSKYELSPIVPGPAKLELVSSTDGLPQVRRTVFSRFCLCGENVTIGLLSEEEYDAVAAEWAEKHQGEDHQTITRHQWLINKLKVA